VKSRTCVTVSQAQVDALVAGMLGASARVARVAPMRGGTVNTCLGIQLADGLEVVLKVAPPPGYVGLGHERDLLATEADLFRRAGAAGAPVPEVLATDSSGRVVASACLLTRRLPGRPLRHVRLARADRDRVRAELGRAVARIASVTGPAFGYAFAPAPTWRAAFAAMLAELLADAARFAVPLPAGLATVAAAAAPALDAVPRAALVHFDLWDGNVLVDVSGGRPRLAGLVDGERAFWGDPMAELAALALYGDIGRDAAFLGGYDPVALDRGGRLRLGLAQLYLYTILTVDPVPRGLGLARRVALMSYNRRWLRKTLAALERTLG
jgi:aminoglycoside phosphotransferase (APT) family kinase protein